MAELDSQDVTRLLVELSRGDREALPKMLPLLYDELRSMAKHALQHERRGHTLQATALVHEAYLRLVNQYKVRWKNRAHFFAVAAQLMRRILVDHARARLAAKRGGGEEKLPIDPEAPEAPATNVDIMALDEALVRLSLLDPQQARIVELRYFGGMTIAETGEVLGISPATVKREWTMARAWLYRALVNL